jgi:hypothetical protein
LQRLRSTGLQRLWRMRLRRSAYLERLWRLRLRSAYLERLWRLRLRRLLLVLTGTSGLREVALPAGLCSDCVGRGRPLCRGVIGLR